MRVAPVHLTPGKVRGLCLMAVGARSGTPAAITLCQVETFQNETHAFGVYSKLGFAWAFAAEVWEATYE